MAESPLSENSSEDAWVRFVPLGGLGQIGMNCFALEQADGIVVVDAGIAFPDDDVGVDVVHPDFSWIWERQHELSGIFITHGHEDHIGALPYLLRDLDEMVPVYAPTHACALIAARLAEHDIDASCLHEVAPGNVYPVGPFSIEPIAVAHSIVDATALAITTRSGVVLHTGDFDLDESQPAGHLTNEARLRELGESGVRLLLSDSTNVEREVRSGSEAEVIEALGRAISGAPERVVVTLFSSNVHRLSGLIDIAKESGRRICLLGRSLKRQWEAAVAIGRLSPPSNLLIAPEALAQTNPREVLVLAGGSQAEPASSLRRLSLGTYHQLTLEAGDRVVISARTIPGNERPVLDMINDLYRLGIDVRWPRLDPGLHTSGHAGRSEQRKMIQWVQPDAFVPLHGTLHHMRLHRDLAEEEGVVHTAVVENGSPVRIAPNGPLNVEPAVRHGLVRIAMGGEELDPATRKRRQDLARSGVATVAVVLDERGRLVADPSFTAFGIPSIDGDDEARRLVDADVRAALRAAREQRSLPISEMIRRSVRRTINELSGVRAVVEVHVVTSDGQPRERGYR